MSRIIYLISVLDKISNFTLLFLILSIGALFLGGWFYLDSTEMLSDSEEKSVKGFLKVAGIFFVVSTLATVLIPSKEEMYIIALTKNYKAEDVYRMTKDEIKGSIDYIFDKIEELKEG